MKLLYFVKKLEMCEMNYISIKVFKDNVLCCSLLNILLIINSELVQFIQIKYSSIGHVFLIYGLNSLNRIKT